MLRALICLMAIVFAVVAPAAAEEPLPRDERNITGEFENGLKYLIRHNANPPGRVEFYLHVRTGSTNETDAQNGLAHFLEHMAFNGSTHFKPGELVPLLSRMGMRFGADTNAHTTFHETVYKLNLPDVKPETIDTGLKIFSDYANGLELSTHEIDEERGIILEELRTGQGPEERIRKQMMKTVFADTKLGIHDVIGDAELIKSMPRDQFVDYWNTWYRPENMTLIVVGDVQPQDVIAKATPWLGSFAARGPSRPAEKLGFKPTPAPAAYVFTDPELVAASVSILSIGPARPPIRTFEQYRQQTVENIATWIVNRRFSDLVNTGKAPFRSASAEVGDFLNEATQASADARGEPQDWNAMFDAMIGEISRAIDFGFGKSELELARSGMIASTEEAVKTESTRDNSWVIFGLSHAVGMDLPMLSAEQRLELLKRTFETVTVDELHKAFAEGFKTRNYLYIVTMPSDKPGVTVPTSEDILSAVNAAWARKTEPLKDKELGGQLLASEPTEGKVVSSQTDPDLAITTVTYENGVVMHHKFSDYKKDHVQVQITLPGGSIEETADTQGLSMLAGVILRKPATSKFTSTQIRDMMTGKTARMFGLIGMDTLSLSVSGTPGDLPFGMQLAHALLTDGRLEQSSVDEWKKTQIQQLNQMKRQPFGPMQELQAKLFYGGDIRFAPPTPELIESLQRSPAEAWFHRIAANAAIEVAVVGQIALEDAVKLVGRYVGSLPKRNRSFDALDDLRKLNRGPGPFAGNASYPSVTPQALAIVGFVTCGERDPDRRPLTLAASILTERMIKRIREKEQLAYGIGATHRAGRGMPGTGALQAGSMTDPQKSEKLAETILEMYRDFALKGPSEDEVATAKKQTATDLATQMKEPSFWLGQISEFTYRGRTMQDIKELPGIYETFSAADLQAVVAKYFKEDAVIRYVIVPEAKAPPTTAPAIQPAPVGS